MTDQNQKPESPSEDLTIKCAGCQAEFIFTVGEQGFYQRKGFVERPKRCKACREARKQLQRG